MAKGRPPRGPEMADYTGGSEHAKERLKLILQTVSGEISAPEAAMKLGISETAFHKLRSKWFEESVALLEPGKRGRPARILDSRDEEIASLQQEMKDLLLRYQAACVREEIALIMPHVLRPRTETAKKKKRRSKRKSRKK